MRSLVAVDEHSDSQVMTGFSEQINRVLVLEPTTTAWMYQFPAAGSISTSTARPSICQNWMSERAVICSKR